MSMLKAPVRVMRFDEPEFPPGCIWRNGPGHRHLRERDCICLSAGTELIYETTSAQVYFAIHPANWQENPSVQENL